MRLYIGLTTLTACLFMGCDTDTTTEESALESPTPVVDSLAAGELDSENADSAAGDREGVEIVNGVAKFSGENSLIHFHGSKPDGSGHDGGFKQFTGQIHVDEATRELTAIDVEIQTASLYSDAEKLTGHLKNLDFFDVNEHPTATFHAKKFSTLEGDPGKIMVHGELTLLGNTKPVEFPASVSLADGRLTLEAQFDLDRTRFGMVYGEGKINPTVGMTIVVGRSE